MRLGYDLAFFHCPCSERGVEVEVVLWSRPLVVIEIGVCIAEVEVDFDFCVVCRPVGSCFIVASGRDPPAVV